VCGCSHDQKKKSNSCHHFTLHFQTLTAVPSSLKERPQSQQKKGPAANQNCKMGMYYSGKTPIFKTTLTAARTQAFRPPLLQQQGLGKLTHCMFLFHTASKVPGEQAIASLVNRQFKPSMDMELEFRLVLHGFELCLNGLRAPEHVMITRSGARN